MQDHSPIVQQDPAASWFTFDLHGSKTVFLLDHSANLIGKGFQSSFAPTTTDYEHCW